MVYLMLFIIISNLHAFCANHPNSTTREKIIAAIARVQDILEENQNCKCSLSTIGSQKLWNNSDPNSLTLSAFPNSPKVFYPENRSFLLSFSQISRYSSNLCSISIYFSSTSALTASHFFSRTKLSLSIAKRSYHIVLCNPSCAQILSYFTKSDSLLPELFGRHLFLHLKFESELQLWRMDPGNTELVAVSDLTLDRTNFEGRSLIWGTSRSNKGGSPNRRRRGSQSKSAKSPLNILVAGRFNATPKSKRVSGGYGAKHPPPLGWTGLVGAVVKGEVHLTSFLTMTQDRGTDTLPTVTSFPDGIVFVTGLPQLKLANNPIEFVFAAFDYYSWAALLSCLITLSILVSISGRQNLASAVEQLLAPILEQNMSVDFLKRVKSTLGLCICISSWTLSLLFLCVELKTELISSITTPSYTHPPKTFAELLDSSYSILFFAKNESGAGEIFFKDGNNDMVKRLIAKIVGHHNLTDDTCLKATQFTNITVVCLGGRVLVGGAANRLLKTPQGEPLYRISESMVTLFTAGFVSKRMGHISEKLNNILLNYLESGISKFQFPRNGAKKNSTRKTNNEFRTEKNLHSDGIQGFYGMVIITLYAGLCSGCVLVVEIWAAKFKSKIQLFFVGKGIKGVGEWSLE